MTADSLPRCVGGTRDPSGPLWADAQPDALGPGGGRGRLSRQLGLYGEGEVGGLSAGSFPARGDAPSKAGEPVAHGETPMSQTAMGGGVREVGGHVASPRGAPVQRG